MVVQRFRSARLRAKAEAGAAKGVIEPQQLSSPPQTPVAAKKAFKAEDAIPFGTKQEQESDAEPLTPTTSRKRTCAGTLKEDVGAQALSTPKPSTPKIARVKACATPRSAQRTKDKHRALELQEKARSSGIPGHKEPRLKYLAYGLTPGKSPYPEYPHPTAEECHEVFRLLSEAHGDRIKPDVIPPPNPKVAGCGETPCILDGLIRTYISGATTMDNANRAIEGIGARFGLIEGRGLLGEGGVSYKAVHQADVKELFNAIRSGGLADKKSDHIKKILAMIDEECREWQDLSNTNPPYAFAKGATTLDEVWNLEYLRHFDVPDVFVHLLQYPGIGVKTVACVCLFTLQQPVFAVDTHCWRLCKGLGWVPAHANENRTFAHCDVKIPDDLKYRLHQLMIVHGKSCGRCKAGRTERSKGWDDGCVLDHLLTREAMQNLKTARLVKKTKTDENDDPADESASEDEISDQDGLDI